ncbi:MAG: trypsin-like peptidase domain-containing protein [Candidatus Gastranaerophilales bacterium]|nr:trypsin-like peptidase domain-containing protein [Candidatus Gastranaerophilales bacterium]
MVNNSVYSKENDYKGEEFINVTVYERINPAIVLVEAQMLDGLSSGTGCIINKNGIILTSSHVVDRASYIEVTTAKGETYKAEVMKTENSNGDLALLRIKPNKPLPVIKLGDSSMVKVGQKVLAIGNPFGFNGTLTTGIVSRIDYERNKIQTDAAINPGSSGGPILNANGEVIGISQSIFNPDNNKSNIGIGFAVPANEVKKLVSAYLN